MTALATGVAVALLAPVTASADPVTDWLCSMGLTGSVVAPEFCPVPPSELPPPPRNNEPAPPPKPSWTYYHSCTDVRIAGAAPLYRGQPGYSSRLDPDHDGVACEY